MQKNAASSSSNVSREPGAENGSCPQRKDWEWLLLCKFACVSVYVHMSVNTLYVGAYVCVFLGFDS